MNLLYFSTNFVLYFALSVSQNVPPNPFIFPNLKLLNDFPEAHVDNRLKIGNYKQRSESSIPANHEPCASTKPSVVLFLAHSSSSYTPQNEILECLKLEEKTLIKPKSVNPRQSRVPPFRKRNVKTCEELLKLSMFSLINYCRVALGMTTAVASVTNETLYNEIKAKSDQEPEIQKEGDNDVFGIPKEGQNIPSPVRKEEDYRYGGNGNSKSVPAYAVNAIYGFDRFGKPLTDVVTADEQIDAFNIRSKRAYRQANSGDDQKNMIKNDIPDIPNPRNDNNSFWGIMDIVTDTKFSFFGKIFGKEVSSSSDDMTNLDNLGQVKDTSLFQVVKCTLTRLQNKDNPYLMIVIGGELSDLSNKDSQLVQSIKHVMENDSGNNTLFVVTGMCPEDENTSSNSEENVVQIGQKCNSQLVIPVLAKGPETSLLSQCTDLYDVPLTMKNILMKQQYADFGKYVHS